VVGGHQVSMASTGRGCNLERAVETRSFKKLPMPDFSRGLPDPGPSFASGLVTCLLTLLTHHPGLLPTATEPHTLYSEEVP